jgi:hypothetical protein
VRYIHSILHRALRDAVRWGYVVRNVADAADPPKAKTPEMRVWNPAQLRAFLDHVRGDRLYTASTSQDGASSRAVRVLLAHQPQDTLVSWQDVQARTGLSRSRAYTLLREERARLAAGRA